MSNDPTTQQTNRQRQTNLEKPSPARHSGILPEVTKAPSALSNPCARIITRAFEQTLTTRSKNTEKNGKNLLSLHCHMTPPSHENIESLVPARVSFATDGCPLVQDPLTTRSWYLDEVHAQLRHLCGPCTQSLTHTCREDG